MHYGDSNSVSFTVHAIFNVVDIDDSDLWFKLRKLQRVTGLRKRTLKYIKRDIATYFNQN